MCVSEVNIAEHIFKRRIVRLCRVCLVVVCEPVFEEIFERRVRHKFLDLTVDVLVNIGRKSVLVVPVRCDDSGGLQHFNEIDKVLTTPDHLFDRRDPVRFLKSRKSHAVEKIAVQNESVYTPDVIGKDIERQVERIVQIGNAKDAFTDHRFLIVIEFLVFHTAPEILVAYAPRVFSFVQPGFLIKNLRDPITVDAVLSRICVEPEREVIECLVRAAGQLGAFIIRHQDPRCTRR